MDQSDRLRLLYKMPSGEWPIGKLFRSEDGTEFVYTGDGWVRIVGDDMPTLISKMRMTLKQTSEYLDKIELLAGLKRD